MKQEKKDAQKECVVVVNKDPNAGPLDGARAQVNVAKTVFDRDGEHFTQTILQGSISASYEAGTVSIFVPEENIMLAARLDEIIQVMFASAGAYKKLKEEENNKKETNND